MSNMYQKTPDQVLAELGSNVERGLSKVEAGKLLAQHGENRLKEKEGKSLGKMILEQLSDFMIIILLVAAVLSIVAGEHFDGFVIIGIVVLNAVLGISQERKASNALAALKKLSAPKAKVIRDGQLSMIDAKDLVPGDVIKLEAGDYVAADCRLIEAVNLKVDEAALTGESVASEKSLDAIGEDVGIGDQANMVFMSTIVTYGRGLGVVAGTGMSTEIGKIATMLNETQDGKTPLQEKLASFGKFLGAICIAVSIVIVILGLLRGQPLLEVAMTAISLAVAAIPEGLPAVVTVVLAMGVTRMVSRHAIMKNLGAVETLGSTTVICTDKTGTLTQNKMTVVEVYDGEEGMKVTGTGYGFEGQIEVVSNKKLEDLKHLFYVAALCNDSKIEEGGVIGDPTEGALVVMAAKAGYDQATLEKAYPRLSEFPFDSDRKLMSTMHEIQGEGTLVLTKGAPDVVISRCSHIEINGQVRVMEEADRVRLLNKNQEYAQKALRVLGYAYKQVGRAADVLTQEQDLVFCGLSCMIDPPREEAKVAVALCKKAGIRVVMITGDHVVTATAIGQALGIIEDENQALEGRKIDDYDETAFKDKVKTTNVFARVSPEHKVRIVETIKSNGDVAAMTGDGVNDAPALKRADIGIAMGITGTDVSKEAADMILTDDNFSSIVEAVEEGRIIYSNIRKFVGFLLSCNIGEILIIFIAMLAGWAVPLVPVQLLWINLITDSFPAFALGLEAGEKGIMDELPRDPNEPIVNRTMKIALAFQSVGLTLAVLVSYRLGYVFGADLAPEAGVTLARTFAFTTLILGEMLRAYSARSEKKSIFTMSFFGNRYLNLSVLGAIVLLFVVVYVPFLQPLFSTAPMTLIQLMVAVGLSFIPLVFGELAKLVK